MKACTLLFAATIFAISLSACHRTANDAKEVKQSAADAAVFKRQPVELKPVEQFGIGDSPARTSTTHR